ncbi:hypothetical protein IBZ15_19545 [Serratia marcescens]|uniref:hypothetical protein n=1 Tax=Serratia marcescens TaxID=615 RepID=UPI001A1DC733|nr:hypothetical protein [Serratia marcescens]HAT5021470.1 hypothetical protein [Serratia marcescens]
MFSKNKKNGKWLAALLTVLGVVLLLLGGGGYFFTPIMPECNAVIRTTYNNGESSISRVLFISIVNINARESAFIINGTATYNHERFTIARTINMTYTADEGHFLLRPVSIVRRPPDDADREEIDKLFPVVGKDILFTVEKLNGQQYIFADNHSPNFICNKR